MCFQDDEGKLAARTSLDGSKTHVFGGTDLATGSTVRIFDANGVIAEARLTVVKGWRERVFAATVDRPPSHVKLVDSSGKTISRAGF